MFSTMERLSNAKQKMKNNGASLFWLVYCVFLFCDPALNPSLRRWLGTLVVFAVFLAVYYVYSVSCSRRWRYGMVGITFLLGVLSLPWNADGITFFLYAAALLPFVADEAYVTVGFITFECAVMLAEAYVLHALGGSVVPAIGWMGSFLALAIGGGNLLVAKQRKANARLRMAQEEIAALAAVAERERIARDLHDVLGHTLSLIALKSELAGRLTAHDPARAAKEIAEVELTARSALAEVREAIGGYRARGLGAEMEAARKTLNTAGVIVHMEAADTLEIRLTATEESVLALALREAVTNIVRHAHAQTCRLRFITTDGRRRFIIEDDGQPGDTREGNGLRGMRERLRSLGGHLILTREAGTRLEIQLPE